MPCAKGRLQLAYVRLRRRFDLPYIGSVNISPFPDPKSGGVFVCDMMAAFGVTVDPGWAKRLSEHVMSLNDGSWDSSSRRWNTEPQPELAWKYLCEQLEAKYESAFPSKPQVEPKTSNFVATDSGALSYGTSPLTVEAMLTV